MQAEEGGLHNLIAGSMRRSPHSTHYVPMLDYLTLMYSVTTMPSCLVIAESPKSPQRPSVLAEPSKGHLS